MMSTCRPLYYDNLSKYPYVDKSVSILDTDIKNIKMSMDFVYQFVKNSYQCDTINNYKKSYITDIIGPPKMNYAMSHSITDECVLSYTTSFEVPLSTNNFTEQNRMNQIRTTNLNFITIEYHKAVYPIRITIYAKYKSGDIVRIWAQDCDNQWFLLYDYLSMEILQFTMSEHIVTFEDSRIVLSLYMHQCYFKTKIFRLELNKLYTDRHCTKLDAVMFVGTSELILPRSPGQNMPELLHRVQNDYKLPPIYTLNNVDKSSHLIKCWCFECDQSRKLDTRPAHANTSLTYPHPHDTCVYHLDIYYLQKNLHKYCVICKSDVIESFHKNQLGHKQVSQELNNYIYIDDYTHLQFLKQSYKGCLSIKDYSTYEKFMEDLKLLWDKSKESRDIFSLLSDEIILKILHDLDMRSLCRMSRVNKRFYNLSRDFSLYTSLNMRNIYFTFWRSNLSNLFDYFTPRCEHLTYLDLSFCYFDVWKFIIFLSTCGTLLKRLILSSCQSIDDSALLEISKMCQILEDLDLSMCDFINDEGFSYLEKLKCLKRLHLAKIKNIQTETLCRILQRNRQMRDLSLQFTERSLNLDHVAVVLKNSCLNLEKINLYAAGGNLSSKGINALADCKNLQEVNFGYISTFRDSRTYYSQNDLLELSNSFRRLFSSCRCLEKIDLSFCYDYENSLNLEMCGNLKYLNLSNAELTHNTCFKILQCKKLEIINLRYIRSINYSLINQWRERYQNVIFIYK